MNELSIRPLAAADLPACAQILCDVYNNDLWQCRWSMETAQAYLADYMAAQRFIGYAAVTESLLVGAVFAHEKIWWNNVEVFIDEMFVLPAHQGQGIGRALMNHLEAYVRQRGLAGLTLTTNRYAPAPEFYRRLGFSDCEHVLFMAKEAPQ